MAGLKKPIFIYLTITKNYSNVLKNDPFACPSPFLLTYPSSMQHTTIKEGRIRDPPQKSRYRYYSI